MPFKTIESSPFSMKTAFTVAVVVAAFAITCGMFGVTAPAQAQTNSSDSAAADMSTYPRWGMLMRNMYCMRKAKISSGE